MTYRNAKRGSVSPSGVKPRRGAMFIATLAYSFVSLLFSSEAADVHRARCLRGLAAAPLKNKRGNRLVSLYYKHGTPTGFGLQNSNRHRGVLWQRDPQST